MLVGGLTGICILFFDLGLLSSVLFWLNILLLGLIWLSIIVWQMPQHNALAQGFDSFVHRRLVVSNWIRTSGWSLRAVLLVYILYGCWVESLR